MRNPEAFEDAITNLDAWLAEATTICIDDDREAATNMLRQARQHVAKLLTARDGEPRPAD